MKSFGNEYIARSVPLRNTDKICEWTLIDLLLRRPCYGRDSERKVRREIANSNERRRMQSINAGFQSLRKLLQARDKDKLSKVDSFQQVSD